MVVNQSKHTRKPCGDWRRRAVLADIRRRSRPVGRRAGRLAKILNVADRSLRLGDWQLNFCLDLDRRLAERGSRLTLSPAQRRSLAKIADRLGVPPL